MRSVCKQDEERKYSVRLNTFSRHFKTLSSLDRRRRQLISVRDYGDTRVSRDITISFFVFFLPSGCVIACVAVSACAAAADLDGIYIIHNVACITVHCKLRLTARDPRLFFSAAFRRVARENKKTRRYK